MKMKRKRKSFFKYCDKCEEKFQPTGRTVKLCDKCWKEISNARKKRKK